MQCNAKQSNYARLMKEGCKAYACVEKEVGPARFSCICNANAAFHPLCACMCWQTSTGTEESKTSMRQEKERREEGIHKERLAFNIRQTKIPNTSSTLLVPKKDKMKRMVQEEN